MAGRPPIKVYEYTHNGVYIRDYNNVDEFRQLNYPDDRGKRPIFNHRTRNVQYHLTETTIALTERPGREMIKFIVAVHKSEFCKKSDTNNPIEVYNLLGEKVAEFKNQRLLSKLMPHIPQNMVNRQLNTAGRNILNSTGLYFKYKENGE